MVKYTIAGFFYKFFFVHPIQNFLFSKSKRSFYTVILFGMFPKYKNRENINFDSKIGFVIFCLSSER